MDYKITSEICFYLYFFYENSNSDYLKTFMIMNSWKLNEHKYQSNQFSVVFKLKIIQVKFSITVNRQNKKLSSSYVAHMFLL